MTEEEYINSNRQWADDAMRFAVRVCNDRAECEDAVQEALISLWQHHGEVSEAKGKGYLMGAVYRQLMMYFRRQGYDRRYSEDTQQMTQEPDTGFDVRDAIELALQSLSEVQRAVLQLRDVEGYTYHDIGETLKLTDDQVQVYLFRARVAMRKQLKTMGYDEYK